MHERVPPLDITNSRLGRERHSTNSANKSTLEGRERGVIYGSVWRRWAACGHCVAAGSEGSRGWEDGRSYGTDGNVVGRVGRYVGGAGESGVATCFLTLNACSGRLALPSPPLSLPKQLRLRCDLPSGGRCRTSHLDTYDMMDRRSISAESRQPAELSPRTLTPSRPPQRENLDSGEGRGLHSEEPFLKSIISWEAASGGSEASFSQDTRRGSHKINTVQDIYTKKVVKGELPLDAEGAADDFSCLAALRMGAAKIRKRSLRNHKQKTNLEK
ncbi:hypothetical protein E2C01_034097 [Portunus trituberculatus]|uniref:Uncharacterized protein n=1 Tax=Portunus trituberculatus TaxID=210409 RepID=A0A5B7F580_PORTR|nr:hypothetical protein [Portunus trituberculatus]